MKKPFIIVLVLALALAVGLAVSLAGCTDLQGSNAGDVADEFAEQGSDTSLADADGDLEADDADEAAEADHAAEAGGGGADPATEDGHDAEEPADDAAGADDGAEESPEYVAAGGPTRYEDNTPYLPMEGSWRTENDSRASGGTMTGPADPTGFKIELAFKGTGAQLVCGRNNCKGNIYVKLDGESGEVYRYYTVDIETTSQRYQEVIWDSGTLPRDVYTVTIWIATKGVWIDALDIWGDVVT